MNLNKENPLRLLALLGTTAVAAVALTGCSAGRTDVNTMMYKVSVDPVASTPEVSISYAHTPDPEKDVTPVIQVAEQVKVGGGPDASSWSELGAIIAGETASVTVTPPEGASASCSILLDGQKQLASHKGAPGETVTCEATAPARTAGIFRDLGIE